VGHGTASGAARRGRWAALLAAALAALAPAAASAPGPAAGAEFAGLKARLDRQTALLVGFTGQFSKRAEAYYALAKPSPGRRWPRPAPSRATRFRFE
jgi:hypothetical protein